MERSLVFVNFVASALLLVSVSFWAITSAINLESSSYIQIDKGRYLFVTENVIHSTFVKSDDECRMKCVRTLYCQSLNLATVSNDNGMVICELLSTNKYKLSAQLKASNEFDHYTLLGTCGNYRIEQNLSGCEPKSCAQILKEGCKTSDVYSINPDGQSPFSVYCDMETDGGGWTVLQRRQDGSINFTRDWDDYKKGFGPLNGEFWLGNDKIHRLTASQETELKFDLEDFDGDKRFAEYKKFSVLDEDNKYKVSFGAYQGTAGDSFAYHNGMAFTTLQHDNDLHSTKNCAILYTGGWWYNKCHGVNINGRYERGKTVSYATGVVWNTFRGHYYSLKKTEMKIRPETE